MKKKTIRHTCPTCGPAKFKTVSKAKRRYSCRKCGAAVTYA